MPLTPGTKLGPYEIQSQLAQPTPDQSLIKKSLGSLKTILERATGNVLASGWLKVLERLV